MFKLATIRLLFAVIALSQATYWGYPVAGLNGGYIGNGLLGSGWWNGYNPYALNGVWGQGINGGYLNGGLLTKALIY